MSEEITCVNCAHPASEHDTESDGIGCLIEGCKCHWSFRDVYELNARAALMRENLELTGKASQYEQANLVLRAELEQVKRLWRDTLEGAKQFRLSVMEDDRIANEKIIELTKDNQAMTAEIAHLREALQENARLREALGKYADPDNWTFNVLDEWEYGWKVAEAALKGESK